jgi:hypothetical protein
MKGEVKMKNLKLLIVVSLVLAAFCTQSANAISFVDGEHLITPDANTAVSGFAISGNLAAWIDWQKNGGIRATFINDPAHTQYTVDANVWNGGLIVVDGNTIMYSSMDPITERDIIRIANVSDINNPIIEDINVAPQYLSSLDIKNGIAVYAVYDYSTGTKIYAIDLSDPCRTQYPAYQLVASEEYLYTNISLDNRLIAFSGWSDNLSGYYLGVCDINDINNPQTTITLLPQDQENEIFTDMYYLDTSGDWLVMNGSYMGQSGIFALKNYNAEPDDWVFVTIASFAGGEAYDASQAKIDEPFVVWTQQNGNYPRKSSGTSYSLMAAVLLENNRATASTLKQTSDPNIYYSCADISGDQIVWNENISDPITEHEESELFNAQLQIDCGDAGYSLADLNHDCYVNFKDFALFADRWLDCTIYLQQDCTYGEVWPLGEGLFEIVLE